MTIDLLEAKNITDNFLRKNKIDWLFEDPDGVIFKQKELFCAPPMN